MSFLDRPSAKRLPAAVCTPLAQLQADSIHDGRVVWNALTPITLHPSCCAVQVVSLLSRQSQYNALASAAVRHGPAQHAA